MKLRIPNITIVFLIGIFQFVYSWKINAAAPSLKAGPQFNTTPANSADTTEDYSDYFLVTDTSDAFFEADSSYYMEFDGLDTTGFIEYETGEDVESQWMIIRAYLVYDDNTVSKTDLIENDVALWNTIIGEGDGGGPSHRTKIVLNGIASGFKLDIRNGKKTALQKEGLELNGELEFTIEDTGCDPVNILVFFAEGDVLTEKINFMCGD